MSCKCSLRFIPKLIIWVLILLLLISAGTFFWQQKWGQKIQGQNEFSEFARAEQKKHYLSGMYAPFITQDKEILETFNQYFSEFSHLLPKSVDAFSEKLAKKTPVKISPLKDSPVAFDPTDPKAGFLAVGGPPALLTATYHAEQGDKVTYLNNENGWSIAYGSAWHIEEDADAEAPTTYSPVEFMKAQILRALVNRVDYAEIEKTGFFPWRTLDWFGYMKNPSQWIEAFTVAIKFQIKTMQDPKARQEKLTNVAEQCKQNEAFYKHLNEKLQGKLLLPEIGGIIVARNAQEVNDLKTQQLNLLKEGRTLNLLSREDLIKKYGFALQGQSFAEKTHDRVLSPSFMGYLKQYIQQLGGNVINGTLVQVFTDEKSSGGIAKYQTPDGQEHFIPFKNLVMSLGNQEILDFNNKKVFDLIGATGSSGLALVYVPSDYTLPRVSVFGGTNHVPVLSKEPIPVSYQGKKMNLYLIRFTAGASITPAYRGTEAGYHDITITLGLINSVFNTLGKDILVKPITVYGCNRMVSKNGQSDWTNPYPGIHIQYGAGGGGLTRAPDLLFHK